MPFHVELSHAGSGRKWDVQVSEACSFGQLKEAAASLIGVPPEGFNLIFRGRPKSDEDFLVDAGVGPGSKIAAAETAEYRRSRGADAALARAEAAEEQKQEQERERAAAPSSHPLSSPENNNAAAAPPPPASSSSDPIARQLDALEASVAALEREAEAAGLFDPSSFPAAEEQHPPQRTTRSLFSRRKHEETPPSPSNSSYRAALYKDALRLSEFSTQQLLKLDAVELPQTIGGGEAGEAGDGNGNLSTAALAKERKEALRARRKALIKRAQALGDAMDRAKEWLK